MTILREAQKAIQIIKTQERRDDKEYYEGAEWGSRKGRWYSRAGKRASILLNHIYTVYIYLYISSITCFILHKIITFKVNKSKIMSGVATNCSNQHSKLRQNAGQNCESITWLTLPEVLVYYLVKTKSFCLIL